MIKVKQVLKNILAQVSYMPYQCGLIKTPIKVCSVDETINELLQTNKSMVRFGDGEISLISGHDHRLQKASKEIADGLRRILEYQYEDLIVAIPDIFENLNQYSSESQKFWKEHLLFERKNYKECCRSDIKYYNSFVSRFYRMFRDKTQSEKWIEKIKLIWKDKDVVIIEGEKTHNGVGNDLFNGAHSLERIIGPASGAYEVVDQIVAYCKKYPPNRLFLISLGISAKSLTLKLFLEGYRVLDIGQIDKEYEWYLSGALEKTEIPKHEIVGDQANIDAGYGEYVSQIRAKIGDVV